MKSNLVKQLVLGSVAVAFSFVGFAMVTGPADAADPPCARKEFKTKMVKDACKTSQKAANKAMKGFLKSVKKAKKADGEAVKLTCKTCHTALKPDYPLKDNGLSEFTKYEAYLKTKK